MKTLVFLRLNARWLSVGALLTFLSSFGQTFFISLFAGEIRSSFGLSHGEWGGIYTLGTSVSAVLMVWAGGLTDFMRVRTLGGAILACLALACLSMAFLPSAWMLPAVIFALRFTGQGMTSHIAMVAMSRWFVATRGRALSVAALGFSVGEALLPIIFVSVMALVDWRFLWVIAAGIALLGIPVLLGLLRRERMPQLMDQASQSKGMQGKHWTRRQALYHPLFWFMVPALLGPSAFNTAFFFQQVHFAEIKGLAHVELVALFPVFTLLSIGSMIASGWALDKFGTGRLIPFSQIPMVASFLILSATDSQAGVLFGLFFLAMTTGANATLTPAFWAEFYGTRHIGSIKALATAMMVFGSAIGPGVTGGLLDFGIGLETQFIAIAGYFAFTTMMMMVGVGRARASLSY